MSSRPIVIKLGGATAGEEVPALDFVAERVEADDDVVVVHGGGPLVGEWAKRLGFETRFEDGLRVTDERTRDVALAVLAGLANKRLVAALLAREVRAVGISGADAALLAVERADAALGLVGRVVALRPSLLAALLDARFTPVIAPAAVDRSHELVNVNADEVAGAVAAGLGARLLIFVTDVEGVRGPDGKVLPRLDRAAIASLRGKGVVSGGMIPKLEACLVAAAEGCVTAIVSADRNALRRLADGGQAGTVVSA
jgi:acetylglutamate kinase